MVTIFHAYKTGIYNLSVVDTCLDLLGSRYTVAGEELVVGNDLTLELLHIVVYLVVKLYHFIVPVLEVNCVVIGKRYVVLQMVYVLVRELEEYANTVLDRLHDCVVGIAGRVKNLTGSNLVAVENHTCKGNGLGGGKHQAGVGRKVYDYVCVRQAVIVTAGYQNLVLGCHLLKDLLCEDLVILAAVLIPTFAGIINKANQSADMQAVRQMNTLLAMEDVNKPQSISEAKTILLASDIDMQDYKPLAKNMYFYWVKSLNRVLYVNADNTVKYPEEYAAETYELGDWYSLSGEITESDAWTKKVSNGTASIASGAELVSLMKAYNNNSAEAKNVTTITLTGDIDLMGSAANFATVSGSITIDGAGHTIYGVNSNESVSNGDNAAGNLSSYAYGLFGKIGSGDVVTLKNVTISGAVIDDPENPAQVGHAGIIAGSVSGTGKLTLENVTIENCFVRGEKKVGALVGYVDKIANGAISLNNVTISKTTVTGAREVAALFGFVQGTDTTITGGAAVKTEGITVEVDASYGLTYENDNALATYPNGAKKAGVTTKAYWYVPDGISANAVATDFN